MTTSLHLSTLILAAMLAAFASASASSLPTLPFFQRDLSANDRNLTLPQARNRPDHQGMFFIENRGQWNREVKFLLKSHGLDMWITDHGVRYDLFSLTPAMKRSDRELLSSNPNTEPPEMTRSGHVVGIGFEGASFSPTPDGIRQQPGAHNYFIGNDRSTWASGVRLFAEARLENLYDGIDARFYLDQGRPRYDLIVQPGADPAQVRMKIEGSNGVSIGSDESLMIATAMGVLEQRGLYAYQQTDGVRRQVACRFVVEGNRVGFVLGEYDRSRTLVIDPLVYSTYLGGSGSETAYGIAVDDNANAYVCGTTASSDFPLLGRYQDRQPLSDVFVTKLTHSGSGSVALVYSTYLGGDNNDVAYDIAVDHEGAAYVTGYTESSDYPIVKPYQGNRAWDDGFVTKLTHDGSGSASLAWSTYLGGQYIDMAFAIAVDEGGDAYVTGYTASSNFPTVHAYQKHQEHTNQFQDKEDAFVTRLTYDGGDSVRLVYSTYIGGNAKDRGNDIAVDGNHNVYITGYAASPNFPTLREYQQHLSFEDVFVMKLSWSEGDSVRPLYSTLLGGSEHESGRSIAVDAAGSAYITGFTASANFPTVNRYQGFRGGNDAFVAKLTDNGSDNVALAYSTYLGGDGDDDGYGLAMTGNGNVYVTGRTSSPDFPTLNHHQSDQAGYDAFLTRLRQGSNGRVSLVYSTYLGGSSDDFGRALAVDGDGSAYLTGRTASSNFPTTNHLQTDKMSDDAFVAKLSFDPQLGVAPEPADELLIFSDHRLTPNPAHDNLLCSFALPIAATVTMKIYTTDGRMVSRPVREEQYEAGTHTRNIPVAELPPGVYLLRVEAGTGWFVERFVVIR